MISTQAKWLFWLGVAIVLGLNQGCLRKQPDSEEPVPAPEFSIQLFEGGEFRSAEIKGQPMVVNFFASWCVPCGEEAPYLERSYRKYKPDGVRFVSIAIQDTKEKAIKFLKKHKLTLPAGMDESEAATQKFKVMGVPTTYFIDKRGMIHYTHLGAVTEVLIDDEIQSIR